MVEFSMLLYIKASIMENLMLLIFFNLLNVS